MDTDNTLSGEKRYSAKRRAFWRYLTLTFAAFLLIGLLSGFVQSAYRDGEIGLWVPVTVGIVLLVALTWYTWDYFTRRIDELDLMDNLWAHLVGQYVALVAFMGWYFLADLGVLATFPTAFGVILTMIGATLLAYAARKLGLR